MNNINNLKEKFLQIFKTNEKVTKFINNEEFFASIEDGLTNFIFHDTENATIFAEDLLNKVEKNKNLSLISGSSLILNENNPHDIQFIKYCFSQDRITIKDYEQQKTLTLNINADDNSCTIKYGKNNENYIDGISIKDGGFALAFIDNDSVVVDKENQIFCSSQRPNTDLSPNMQELLSHKYDFDTILDSYDIPECTKNPANSGYNKQ